jgi:hypothetical protein
MNQHVQFQLHASLQHHTLSHPPAGTLGTTLIPVAG